MPRTQIKAEAIKRVLALSAISKDLDEKRAAVKSLIARILVYSAIKISANGPLLYSVLNPDTSSDSPSARSNGVRFVSASIVTNQIRAIGITSRAGHEAEWKDAENIKDCVMRRAVSKIRAILTS